MRLSLVAKSRARRFVKRCSAAAAAAAAVAAAKAKPKAKPTKTTAVAAEVNCVNIAEKRLIN